MDSCTQTGHLQGSGLSQSWLLCPFVQWNSEWMKDSLCNSAFHSILVKMLRNNINSTSQIKKSWKTDFLFKEIMSTHLIKLISLVRTRYNHTYEMVNKEYQSNYIWKNNLKSLAAQFFPNNQILKIAKSTRDYLQHKLMFLKWVNKIVIKIFGVINTWNHHITWTTNKIRNRKEERAYKSSVKYWRQLKNY